ncbi:hypothetical protein [Catalinimonas niigatensis]|uniref:hypothetical protein n=1 Tax=Catalinimonas niigatensis TaxID=1397264 RepID=UPI0026662393|nr:hypothetical protein [Catalinimonas niigatensis]WPP52553.1 hypothetical protein PZB72_09185 [Catalinimonas niigatensis]
MGHLLDSLALHNVTTVSHDALGNLYLSTADGALMKLNKQLVVEQNHSSVYIPRLTSLEAAQMLKVFTFYQNSQQFQFFDRFLTPSPTNTIKTKMPSHFSAATLSNDQMIWLYDDTHLQLIKYNPILEEVILKIDIQYFLPVNAQVKALKEYGNRLYLWQNNELLVFDFLGNLIQKLPVDISKPFSFYENQLYYSEGTQVCGYDLSTMQQKRYSFPLSQEIRFVIRIESHFFLFTKDQLKVFEFEP